MIINYIIPGSGQVTSYAIPYLSSIPGLCTCEYKRLYLYSMHGIYISLSGIPSSTLGATMQYYFKEVLSLTLK